MDLSFGHGVYVNEGNSGARPITITKTGVIGIVGTAPNADAETFPFNEPVLIAGNFGKAADLDIVGNREGTLPDAVANILDQIGAAIVVVRVEVGADDAETTANVIGGVNAVDGGFGGFYSLLGAQSKGLPKPKILIAPGFTHQLVAPAQINPVAATAITICERLRAIAVVDGTNTTDAAANAAASLYGSDRVYFVDPFLKSARDLEYHPASSFVAGVIARTDTERGAFKSPSKEPINGIVGVQRPIDYAQGDRNSRAVLLNDPSIGGAVATVINEDGFRLFGNLSTTDDTKYQFLTYRRVADAIIEGVQEGHFWAVDEPLSKTLVDDLVEGVRSFLREMTAAGWIYGGDCWPDEELNTAETVAAGKLYLNFDFQPTAVAQVINFTADFNTDYANEVFA